MDQPVTHPVALLVPYAWKSEIRDVLRRVLSNGCVGMRLYLCDRVLRKILGTEREEVIGDWRKHCNVKYSG